MNKTYFISRVKSSLFGGRISKTQIDGLLKIVAYRDEKWPNMPDEELAYILATAKHETAHTMQPVTEYGSKAYLRGKPYWPWIGRGLVQITWKANYDRYGIKNPEDALTWPGALHVLFHGSIVGTFTGRKLSNYIGAGKRDYVGARRIINGTDKAKLIAGQAESFLDALKQAKEKPAPAQQVQAPDLAAAAPKPAGMVMGDPEDQATGKAITKSTTAGAATVAGAAGAAGPAVEAIKQAQEAAEAGKGIWDIAASVGPWVLLALVIAAAAGYIIWERRRKAREEGV